MKIIPKKINKAEVALFTYLVGRSLRNFAPKNMPMPVVTRNASIVPMKTRMGEENLAAKAITANCVLSPSSIKVTSEKDVANEKPRSLNFISRSPLETEVWTPNATNTRPEISAIHLIGKKLARASPKTTLKPSTTRKASIAPRNTDKEERFADNEIETICVLSPSSANATTAKVEAKGTKFIVKHEARQL